MLAIAASTLVLSWGLWIVSRIAVLISVIVAACILITTIYFLAFGGNWSNGWLYLIALCAGGYLSIVVVVWAAGRRSGLAAWHFHK